MYCFLNNTLFAGNLNENNLGLLVLFDVMLLLCVARPSFKPVSTHLNKVSSFNCFNQKTNKVVKPFTSISKPIRHSLSQSLSFCYFSLLII